MAIHKAKYAPDAKMFKVTMPAPAGDIVFLYDPDDIEEMFRQEAKHPARIPIPGIELLYTRRPDLFSEYKGLLLDNGEDWYKIRSTVQQDMMRPKSALNYLPELQEVSGDFLKVIRRIRDGSGVIDSFLPQSELYAFEAISLVALDVRMGGLDENKPPETIKMLENVKGIAEIFPRLIFGVPIFLPNPRWHRKYRIAEDFAHGMFDFVKDRISAARDRILKNPTTTGEPSILEKFIEKSGQGSSIPTVVAIDMLLAGIDTTANTISNILYLFSKNQDAQERVRAEIMAHVGKTGEITNEVLNKCKLVRASMKESLRMFPLIIGNFRATDQDIVVGNHLIPAKTNIGYYSEVITYNEKYFEDAKCFKPERWLRENSKSIHSFASLPFGYGPRSCVGRRFAELEIQLATIQILRNFRVEWAGHPNEELEGILKNVVTMNKPVKLKFVDI